MTIERFEKNNGSKLAILEVEQSPNCQVRILEFPLSYFHPSVEKKPNLAQIKIRFVYIEPGEKAEKHRRVAAMLFNFREIPPTKLVAVEKGQTEKKPGCFITAPFDEDERVTSLSQQQAEIIVRKISELVKIIEASQGEILDSCE